MADEKLTPSECALLIVLMAEAREISNPELERRYHISVERATRERLKRLQLVSNRKGLRGAYFLVLDDKGWVRVHDELNFDSPRARALGGALAALHANLRDRVLNGRAFGDLFKRGSGGEPAQQSLAARLRAAYTSLASEPGAWVSLTRVRRLFRDVSAEALDEALLWLSRAEDVNIIPESNQKTLTDADRDAAVRIGGQSKHLLAIGLR